jgi:hypothetical protein
MISAVLVSLAVKVLKLGFLLSYCLNQFRVKKVQLRKDTPGGSCREKLQKSLNLSSVTKFNLFLGIQNHSIDMLMMMSPSIILNPNSLPSFFSIKLCLQYQRNCFADPVFFFASFGHFIHFFVA